MEAIDSATQSLNDDDDASVGNEEGKEGQL